LALRENRYELKKDSFILKNHLAISGTGVPWHNGNDNIYRGLYFWGVQYD